MNTRVLNLSGVGLFVLAAGLVLLAGCDGSSSKTASGRLVGTGARLTKVEYGRLVDIYSYRRVDSSRADRRDTLNRVPVIVAKDVIVNPSLRSDSLFDAVGAENPDADYRFLEFDVNVGHEELLILWDQQAPAEAGRFEEALRTAKQSLVSIPGAYRGQNTALVPIPVVPRNAALLLTFDERLDVSEAFFEQNPSALQLLEFRGDPNSVPAPLAFLTLPRRVIPLGEQLIVDTSLIGAEATSRNSNGLPASRNSVLANIRLAMPKSGLVPGISLGDDPVPELNGVDVNGDPAVIRDFRSGNASDGPVAALTDEQAPSVVKDAEMGITAITPDNPGNPLSGGLITLDKRSSMVAVRGRIPFVDGGINPGDSLPTGPQGAPTIQPLRSGDILTQLVTLATGEVVRLRAEILAIQEVGNIIGQPGFPGLGLTQVNTDGGELPMVSVRVASLVAATDSTGAPVSFVASAQPPGERCNVRVHYYHNVPYTSGQSKVSDAAPTRIPEFLTFTPPPPGSVRNVDINPLSAVSMSFSEPMDLTVVQNVDNFLLSSNDMRAVPNVVTVDQLLQQPKPTGLSVLVTRLVDERGDATVLRLVPPLGLFHEGPSGGPGQAESYWFHMLTGDGGPADLAGNGIDLFDRRQFGAENVFSVPFTLDPNAPDNLVASRLLRFASIDEDGTPDGSVDYFGQFQISNGEISGAAVQRFSATADGQNLGGIQLSRWDRGECWDPTGPPANPPVGSVFPSVSLFGQLYICPNMVAAQTAPQIPVPFRVINTQSVPFGGILEPHNPRGSRLQMTYHEDDFSLDYTNPAHMNLDLEQLHWAPWENTPVQYDIFDRVTIDAAHADVRPDLLFAAVDLTGAMPPTLTCELDCSSMVSGLSTTFANNVLEGTQLQSLVRDTEYQINPNAASLPTPGSGTIFVPYAEFQRTYTWRDSRLVTWDMASDRAVGLGGAKLPEGVPPNRDRTTHISSPWIPELPEQGAAPSINYFGTEIEGEGLEGFTGTVWVGSAGDFRGDRTRDHDPIAMPLLLDFKVYADDPSNGLARGVNQFHIGYIGTCWDGSPGPKGYYPGSAGSNSGLQGYLTVCGSYWPNTRVHTSGGLDGLNGQAEVKIIDPANRTIATGGWIYDPGLGDVNNGLVQHPGFDDHIQWAKADFVRKVSVVTTGFFDTQQPNKHALDPMTSSWPGAANSNGFPDLATLATNRGVVYGVSDMVTVVDPPLQTAPAGTSVGLELRGVETFTNSHLIYDRQTNDRFDRRGNLLNPNYACEAYRYAMPNSGATKNLPRIPATGMTPYVQGDHLDSIRDLEGLLPRFFNMRLVFQNDTGPDPVESPSLRSVGIVYRLTER